MKQNTTLQLDKITTDAGTQARAGLNEDVVAEYAEAIIAGADMPPITVFHDGKRHILADGFHRYFAHVKARAVEIAVDVRTGTKRDAILYSVGANGAHGLRRTNEDKRCAVRTLLADAEWKKWSDRQIADACGVSQPFVSAIRRPEIAQQQKAARTVSKERGVLHDQHSDNGLHTQQNNNLQAKKSENRAGDGYFPWSTKADEAPSKPVEKPEPEHDDGPTLSELVDELQRENEELRALIKASEADDLKAEAIKWRRAYEHAKREQGVAMDSAAKSQDREKYIVRMLRMCAKAVGVKDPNHTDPRDIVKAVQRMAAEALPV